MKANDLRAPAREAGDVIIRACSVAAFGVVSCLLVTAYPQPSSASCDDGSEPASPRRGASAVRAVGRSPASIGQWPWLAALVWRDRDKRQLTAMCAGSVIDRDWVLTAAQCVADFDPVSGGSRQPDDLEIILGVDDLRKIRPENVFRPARIIVHEEFAAAFRASPSPGETPAMVGRDLALVRLSRPWQGPLAPLSLSTSTDPAFEPVSAAGFGIVAMQGLRRYALPNGERMMAGCARAMQVTMPLIATKECMARAPQEVQAPAKPVIGGDHLCAGFTQGGQHTTCTGDAGAPLVVSGIDGRFLQVGVASWGSSDCGAGLASFDVFSRISRYSTWILKHTNIVLSVPDVRRVPISEATSIAGTLDDLDFDLSSVKGRVKVEISGGNKLSLGRTYKLQVSSAVAGQLIIVDVDAANRATQIYPTNFAITEEIRAGEPVTIPGKGWQFDAFQAAEPVGAGKLVVLVAPRDFVVEETQRQGVKGFTPLPSSISYLMNVSQQVSTHVAKARLERRSLQDSWAYNVIDYEIVRGVTFVPSPR